MKASPRKPPLPSKDELVAFISGRVTGCQRTSRIERMRRSITEVRWQGEARQVMKATLRDAVKQQEHVRRAGWFN